MTVTYDAGSKRFEIYDGEENVADLTTAKGSAPADDDTTYIYTDTSEGILGISPGETMKGTIYVGKKPDGSDSAGTLKIYGGGTYQMASSVSLELNPGYGTLKTSGTTSASHATINANQCNNDLKLTGGLDCDLLDITNIKSGGTVDLQDATGTLLRTSFSGYSDASFSITGVPDEGFFARGISLGRAVSGIYTESGYPDIDLVNDAAIVEVTAERSTGATALAVPGRKAGRVRFGSQAPLGITLKIRAASGKADDIMQAWEYIQAEELYTLLVVRSHGSDFTYPSDILIRAVPAGVPYRYPPGDDYRDMVLKIVEVT